MSNTNKFETSRKINDARASQQLRLSSSAHLSSSCSMLFFYLTPITPTLQKNTFLKLRFENTLTRLNRNGRLKNAVLGLRTKQRRHFRSKSVVDKNRKNKNVKKSDDFSRLVGKITCTEKLKPALKHVWLSRENADRWAHTLYA